MTGTTCPHNWTTYGPTDTSDGEWITSCGDCGRPLLGTGN